MDVRQASFAFKPAQVINGILFVRSEHNAKRFAESENCGRSVNCYRFFDIGSVRPARFIRSIRSRLPTSAGHGLTACLGARILPA